jgi:hypothetical protein
LAEGTPFRGREEAIEGQMVGGKGREGRVRWSRM